MKKTKKPTEVNIYQERLQNLLADHFESDIETEWRTKMGKKIYSPCVDVAVGPFAIEDGVTYTNEHDEIFEQNIELFRRLTIHHLINTDSIKSADAENAQQLIGEKLNNLQATNRNGRCMLAIEVENKSSRKHLMGGAVNASVLSRVGIAVGFDDEKHRAFLNLYRYFEFLRRVEKPTFNTNNLLIISKEQLEDILSE